MPDANGFIHSLARGWPALICGAFLLFFATIFMFFNWYIFVLTITRKLPKDRHISSFPLLGGIFGMLAFNMLPYPWFNHHWWLPFLVDISWFTVIPLLLMDYVREMRERLEP
jgi:hypothetical protein